MINDNTTTVRVSKESHDTLRFMAYKQNKKIIDIIEELLKGKGPTISEKVETMLKRKS